MIKNIIFIFFCLQLFFSPSFLLSEGIKVKKTNFILEKELYKNNNAENSLKKARLLMNRQPAKYESKMLFKPGWNDSNTFNKLYEVIKIYPNSKSALTAKLRMAVILGSETNNKDWSYEIFNDLSSNNQNTWQGKYAGIYQHNIKKKYEEKYKNKDWNALVDIYKTHLIPVFTELAQETDLEYKEFEEDLIIGKEDSLIATVYENLFTLYCKKNDLSNAKTTATLIIDKFPKSTIAIRTKAALRVIEQGKNPYTISSEIDYKNGK